MWSASTACISRIVVAETFEQATEAARLLKVEYEAGEPVFDIKDPKAKPQPIDASQR